ncbi:hypothetical protein V6N13_012229 [Hibiscus sabdariffa]|uniref:Uncharacterized protein n=1 Tax=Hibiscus sabdariffa TaxID=183260 RepID=A0ABR2SFE5_9ROSI
MDHRRAIAHDSSLQQQTLLPFSLPALTVNPSMGNCAKCRTIAIGARGGVMDMHQRQHQHHVLFDFDDDVN